MLFWGAELLFSIIFKFSSEKSVFSAIDTDLSKTVFKSDEGYSEGEKPGKMAKNDTTVCEENVSLRHLFIYPRKNLLAKVLEAQSDTQTLRWFSLTDVANLRKSVKNIASFVSVTKIRLKNVTQVTGTSSAVFLLSWHKKIVTHGCQQFRTLAVLHPKQKAYPKPQAHFTEDILPANTEKKRKANVKFKITRKLTAIQNPSWANFALSKPIVVNKKANRSLSG